MTLKREKPDSNFYQDLSKVLWIRIRKAKKYQIGGPLFLFLNAITGFFDFKEQKPFKNVHKGHQRLCTKLKRIDSYQCRPHLFWLYNRISFNGLQVQFRYPGYRVRNKYEIRCHIEYSRLFRLFLNRR
jgi:hypothetical protein